MESVLRTITYLRQILIPTARNVIREEVIVSGRQFKNDIKAKADKSSGASGIFAGFLKKHRI